MTFWFSPPLYILQTARHTEMLSWMQQQQLVWIYLKCLVLFAYRLAAEEIDANFFQAINVFSPTFFSFFLLWNLINHPHIWHPAPRGWCSFLSDATSRAWHASSCPYTIAGVCWRALIRGNIKGQHSGAYFTSGFPTLTLVYAEFQSAIKHLKGPFSYTEPVQWSWLHVKDAMLESWR